MIAPFLGVFLYYCTINPVINEKFLPLTCGVPLQGATAPRKAGRKTGAAGAAGGNATWVATGAAADAQYSEARVVARDHMRLRNQLFQQVC